MKLKKINKFYSRYKIIANSNLLLWQFPIKLIFLKKNKFDFYKCTPRWEDK